MEAIQQPPAGQGGNLKEVNKMEIKSIERNDDLQGFIVTLSNNKIVQIQYELNTNRLDADHNTHYPVIDKQNDYGYNLTAREEEKFEAWMHAQWIKTGTQIREYAEELDSKYEEEQKYRETLSSEELAQHKFYYDDLGNFIG